MTGGQHQTNYNAYRKAGYRIISLSVHGASVAPRYTAVWRKIGGPDWRAFHGKPISQYQKYVDDQNKAGFRPYIVTATGTAGGAVMAGVFIKDPQLASWHGLTAAGFRTRANWARDNAYMPIWVSAYGSGSDKRFIVVYRKSTVDRHWSYSLDMTKAKHQELQTAHATTTDRPALVTKSAMGTFTALWRDDKIGAYVPFTDLTEAPSSPRRTRWLGSATSR